MASATELDREPKPTNIGPFDSSQQQQQHAQTREASKGIPANLKEYAGESDAGGSLHQRETTLHVSYTREDVTRMAKEVYDKTIADVHLSLFGYWICESDEHYELAKQHIRELDLDQGYNVERIKNAHLRKLVTEAHQMRPKVSLHAAASRPQTPSTTPRLHFTTKSRSLFSSFVAKTETLPSSLRDEREELVMRKAARYSSLGPASTPSMSYPPDTPDRPAPLSLRSRSSKASSATPPTTNTQRSASSPPCNKHKYSIWPSLVPRNTVIRGPIPMSTAPKSHPPIPPRSYEGEAHLDPTLRAHGASNHHRANSATERLTHSGRLASLEIQPLPFAQAIPLPPRLTSVLAQATPRPRPISTATLGDRFHPGHDMVPTDMDHDGESEVHSAVTEPYTDIDSQHDSIASTLRAFPIPPMKNPVGELPMLISQATLPPEPAATSTALDEAYRAVTEAHITQLLQRTRDHGAQLPVVDWNHLSSFERAWREVNEQLLISIYGRKDIVLADEDVQYVDCVRELQGGYFSPRPRY